MRLSGRFVWVFQWIAPVLLVLMLVFGRGLLGAPLGWMTVAILLWSPAILLALYVPPILVCFDREARAARRTRRAYDAFCWLIGVAMLVFSLTIEDGGDAPPYGSVLSTWGVMSSDADSVLGLTSLFATMIGWTGALVTAIVGIVLSRTAPAHGAQGARVA